MSNVITKPNTSLTTGENFNGFNQLKSSLARLISAQSDIDEKNKASVDAIVRLAEKIEISSFVQTDDFIAIAGMQGAGKTTIVKSLYKLPSNLLDINTGRSEQIPVFINEDINLNEGEYRAEYVFVDKYTGELCRDQLDIDKVASYSKGRGNTAFVELFVPVRYNATFVLLPGFEKDCDRNFDSVYNSLIDYTLHFAKAVLLVVDNAGTANIDIQHLITVLGEKFSPSNCVFAISKCELNTPEENEDLRETLFNVCKENQLHINKNQIVCTCGEENDDWHMPLMSCIEGNIVYTASKKSYDFFRPMAEEISICAKKIKDDITIQSGFVDNNDRPEFYTELEMALKEARKSIVETLENICEEEKRAVSEKFITEYDAIDKSHKTDKKYMIFNKTEGEKQSDRKIIGDIAEKCLYSDGVENELRFTENLRKKVSSELELSKESFNENYNNYATQIIVGNAETDERKIITEGILVSMFNANVEPPIIDSSLKLNYKNLSRIIATRFKNFYYGMITNPVENKNICRDYDSIEKVAGKLNNASEKKGRTVKLIAAIDLLDGSPDIMKSVAGIGASLGLEAAMPYIGAAAAVATVAALGVNIHNKIVKQQNILCKTWVYSLYGALEEYKEKLIESYDDGCAMLLERVCDVHKTRNHVDDTRYRLSNAKYAAEGLIQLVADMDAMYAKGTCHNE